MDTDKPGECPAPIYSNSETVFHSTNVAYAINFKATFHVFYSQLAPHVGT